MPVGIYPRASAPDRFWKYVRKTDTCWLWTGGTTGGYGSFSIGRHRKQPAHRFSWALHYGPIPDGLWVLHQCDNPPCVRPDHLFLGTVKDNARDMAQKGRGTHYARSWPKGEANPRARLTEDVVRIIRARALTGETQSSLGREFGVKWNTIWLIVHERTWRHIL